jgi:hypothetical protein
MVEIYCPFRELGQDLYPLQGGLISDLFFDKKRKNSY